MGEGIGDRFQRETKYRRERMPFRLLNWSRRPETYKEYPESEKVGLPEPRRESDLSVDEAIRGRRSVRDFAPEPVTIRDLSYLLWASTGIQRSEGGFEFRTAPSAGALYPIDTYLVANRVEGLEQGLYHYSIERHLLEVLKLGDLAMETARAALDQAVCLKAACVFVWSAVFDRSKWKYEQRAYRYVYLDAGHIAENLYLAAESLSLGVCSIAAIYDDELNGLLGIDGVEESAIYMAVVGVPEKA